MSASLDISTNYSGKYAGQFIAPAVLSGKMISRSLINKFLMIKSKMNIPVVRLNGVIQVYATDFAASENSVVISDRVLDPQGFTVNLEFPINILEQLHLAEQMSGGMINSDMPADFQSFVIAYVIKEIGKTVDNFIWNSDTAGAGVLAQFDGLLKLFAAVDSGVLTQGIEALTQANIITELNKVYDKVPDDLSEDPNLKVYTSVAAVKLYKQALSKIGLLTPNQRINGSMLYDENIEVVAIPNFPANTIVATSSNNLAFGTDMESDMQTFQLIDMRFTTGDRKLRIRMDFKIDVNYAFGDQIVLATVP